MSEQQRDKSEENQLPKNYWQFVTRLCLLAAGVCVIFLVMPDSPPLMKEKARLYLPQIVGSWLLLSALPWSILRLWQHRAALLVRWRNWRAVRDHPRQTMITPVSGDTSDRVEVTALQQASMSGERHTLTPEEQGYDQALTPPLTELPVNPNPRPRAEMTMETAGAAISTALQLAEFSVEEEVQVLKVEAGPVLQIVSFQLPPKVQLSKLAAKKEDIANHLGPQQGFDITAAKAFKSAASFVIPHDQADRAFVYLRDIAAQLLTFAEKATLPMIFGKDMRGNPMLYDLVKMPHLLVCGATGSGKSVFVNTLLTSLLSVRSPAQIQLLLIDPKQVEFGIYKGLPHLIAPPVTDMKRAVQMIEKVIVEMEQRYERFADTGTRNLASYNAKHPEQPLPSIVIVIDEYADLMLVAGDVIEHAVQRITQMARAAGIHLILGTQRPSVNVVTGTIKSNLPSRVTFKLPSTKDYMTVLDRGAPKLLGFGDGVCTVQGGDLQRFQSAAISVIDGEDTAFIEQLIAYWSARDQTRQVNPDPSWMEEQEEVADMTVGVAQANVQDEVVNTELPSKVEWEPEEDYGASAATKQSDPYLQALELVREEGGFKVSSIQRELRIGFGAAAELAERMMAEGIIGAYDPESKWRPLLQQKQERTEEDLLTELRLYICQNRTTRSVDLREALGIQRETVLELMRSLVQEGFLLPPTSTKAGYKIAWDDEKIESFLEQCENEDF
ncbi:FtsK/SpoIIIE domain-containing protein [Paenibacillus sp. HB172176]|uniref:FtsK/SpoIIIE domain-containing protein n=1 Tax=Paenibacillus sp. HB172176 TaxID=2493690 RepID=UPI00143C87BD|nr:FtsK/SpoIIIE domain-containing protein [Paenibacillus sp. HB172176]